MTLLLTLAAIPFAIAAGQYVRHLIKTVRRIGELGQLHTHSLTQPVSKVNNF